MDQLTTFLKTSYTAYHAVENSAKILLQEGFTRLFEHEPWNLKEGGKYFVIRGGCSLVAFTTGKGSNFKIIASHADSPALKLKENPVMKSDGMIKCNVEKYGGSILYSFFDRPLRFAGRVVKEENGALVAHNYVSDYRVVIPSVAIHMNREVNDKFSPNIQVDLLPLAALGDCTTQMLLGDCVSYDLFAVCDEESFKSGKNGEFLSSPRVDNLTSVLASVNAITSKDVSGACIVAIFDNEEIGSQTRQGAGGDLLASVIDRIARFQKMSDEQRLCALSSSLLISLDNAHAVHPNHPEKSDPTNRTLLGGGVVIKTHAEKSYTTDALTSSAVKTVFRRANVKYQTFFNRSDIKSGGTLGALSLGQVCVPSVDMGIAQLAMHSAVETFAKEDFIQLQTGLAAFFASNVRIIDDAVLF